MQNPRMPQCGLLSECRNYDGQQIQVTGIYSYYQVTRSKNLEEEKPGLAYLEMPDGIGPFLNPFWHREAVRTKEEIKFCKGKLVKVTGVFYGKQPPNPQNPPGATEMGGSCIYPVKSIELANRV